MPERVNSFPAGYRLQTNREYRLVSKRGRRLHTPHFIVIVLCVEAGPMRLGLTVSRKVGNAVVRNRIKRLIREFFRTHYDLLPEHSWTSVIAKKNAAAVDYATVKNELNILTGKFYSPRSPCSGSSLLVS